MKNNIISKKCLIYWFKKWLIYDKNELMELEKEVEREVFERIVNSEIKFARNRKGTIIKRSFYIYIKNNGKVISALVYKKKGRVKCKFLNYLNETDFIKIKYSMKFSFNQLVYKWYTNKEIEEGEKEAKRKVFLDNSNISVLTTNSEYILGAQFGDFNQCISYWGKYFGKVNIEIKDFRMSNQEVEEFKMMNAQLFKIKNKLKI